MKVLWITNTFRFSAIELTVESFVDHCNKYIDNEVIEMFILQIDDKRFPPATDLIDKLKSKGVRFEVVE